MPASAAAGGDTSPLVGSGGGAAVLAPSLLRRLRRARGGEGGRRTVPPNGAAGGPCAAGEGLPGRWGWWLGKADRAASPHPSGGVLRVPLSAEGAGGAGGEGGGVRARLPGGPARAGRAAAALRGELARGWGARRRPARACARPRPRPGGGGGGGGRLGGARLGRRLERPFRGRVLVGRGAGGSAGRFTRAGGTNEGGWSRCGRRRTAS